MRKNKIVSLLILSLVFAFLVMILTSGSGGSSGSECKYSAVGDVCGGLGAHCGSAEDPECCGGSHCLYNTCVAELKSWCDSGFDCDGPCPNNFIGCEINKCCGRHAHPCTSDSDCCYDFYCSSSGTCAGKGPEASQCVCGTQWDFYQRIWGIDPVNVGSCENPSCGTVENCEIKCGGNLACFTDHCSVPSYLLWPLSGPHEKLCYTFTSSENKEMICNIQVKTSCFGLEEGVQDEEKVEVIINGASVGFTEDPFCNEFTVLGCKFDGPHTTYLKDIVISANKGINTLTLKPVRDSISLESYKMTCEPHYIPYCGNGIIDSGEECDDGANNGIECVPEYGGNCSYCSSICTVQNVGGPYCGDGIIQSLFEMCEFPNTFFNIFCNQTTSQCNGVKLGVRSPFGNCNSVCGCVETPFEYSCVVGDCGAECAVNSDCDDGNPNTINICNTETCGCEIEELPYCGNGIIDFGEQCDDGVNNGVPCVPDYEGSCNYCSDTCTIETIDGPYCGDNIVQNIFEQCELPNTFFNSFCPQISSQCSGVKLGVRDGFGSCNSVCGCVETPFEYSCVVGQCGAECAVNSDCDDGNPNTVNICNTETCGCEIEELCLHDVGIRFSYPNSFGTGIGILEECNNWLSDTPAILTKGKNYKVDYYIDNKIVNTTNNIKVIVNLNETNLFNYSGPINIFHYKKFNLNITNLECNASYMLYLEVSKINETDCDMSDNFAQREIFISCEEYEEPVCGNGIIEGCEECDAGALNGVECVPEYGESCNYCSSTCTIETVIGPYCGDGIVQESHEQCEPPNTSTCDSQCQLIPEICEHDVGIRYSYSNSFGTGIGIRENCTTWLPNTPAILTKGITYDIKYYIDNKIANSTNNINVIFKINETKLLDYNGTINVFHYKEFNLNITELECGSPYILYLEVYKINETDCNMSDNFAQREIFIYCENGNVSNGNGDNGNDNGGENGGNGNSGVLSAGNSPDLMECGGWSSCINGIQTRNCYHLFGYSYYSQFVEKRTCVDDFVPLYGVWKGYDSDGSLPEINIVDLSSEKSNGKKVNSLIPVISSGLFIFIGFWLIIILIILILVALVRRV